MSKVYDTEERLNAAWDRGKADAYYNRGFNKPHIWLDPLGARKDFELSQREIRMYNKGFEFQEFTGDRKEWE